MLQAARAESDTSLSNILPPPESGSGAASPTETDPQIIEALRSKDRLWVLKLGEMMESLITERKQPRIDLTPATSYQRMLVHRCSAYYKLVPETDTVTKTISVYHRTDSRVPPRRMSELVPAEESAQPAFKIMQRLNPERRGRSQPESVTGDDGDFSDVETSEAGSVGGRSNVTGGSKRHLTIEEREAAYNEARSRIFMGFEDKDKDKEMEKGSSANSSSISLVSGSGSVSAGQSSAGDMDDSVSSAATESEWSGPVTRDRRDRRRVGSGGSGPRSTRGTSYNPASGSNSSRHSRAASPSSFTYPSLYDPSGNSYDPTYAPQGPPHGYIQYYYPPYPPPQPTGVPPVMPGYTYPYSSYPYPQPQPRQHSDPTSPNEHPYPLPQQPQHVGYPPQNPYGWAPPPPPPPSHSAPPVTSPPHTNVSLPGPPQAATHPSTPQGQMQYPGYFPPQPYVQYPMPGYYGPAPYAPPPVGPMQPTSVPGYYPDPSHVDPRFNGNGFDNHNHNRAASHNSNGHGRKHGGARKQAWSYPSGVAASSLQYTPPGGNDIVGPRLNSRRTSSSSQGNGNRTPGDETSSVTSSSTTSSSSQRTFTSTSSKHHPLPARPDWAVGLKAQPTLSSTRHHDHSNANSRNMSPARFGGNLPLLGNQRNSQHMPPQPPPQPTDFPPLSSAPEKKTPVIGGAWTNTSSIKSVLRPGPSGSTSGQERSNALVHYPTSGPQQHPNPNMLRLQDDQEFTFERPPPKSNAELYNPKGGRRMPVNSPPGGNNTSSLSGGVGDTNGNYVVSGGLGEVDVLAEQVGGLRVGQQQQAEGGENAFVVSSASTGAIASANES
ncbi:hypothetical protein BDY19DRAFT_931629 [Irpex rosettiformis]|uniref:Uncharacterized protein n=1 Tax=Irpex rosettiformis TaxID=378272 RepID=A0ACB8UBL1_9APHY|nr:hypothetical protein BDY19DRAFT_931629 [Irpex rosettiformis]